MPKIKNAEKRRTHKNIASCWPTDVTVQINATIQPSRQKLNFNAETRFKMSKSKAQSETPSNQKTPYKSN